MPSPIHFCGVTDAHMAARQGGRWSKRALTWYWAGPALGNLPDVQTRAGLTEAFGSWQAVCDRMFREAHPGETPDIVCTSGRIDGPLGILAQSELPPGDDRQLHQEYDQSERLVIAIRPPQGYLDFVAIATHEIGHALGMGHAQDGIMRPTYEEGVRTPQPADIARVVALYGPAVQQPPVMPPNGRMVTIICQAPVWVDGKPV